MRRNKSNSVYPEDVYPEEAKPNRIILKPISPRFKPRLKPNFESSFEPRVKTKFNNHELTKRNYDSPRSDSYKSLCSTDSDTCSKTIVIQPKECKLIVKDEFE